MNWEVLLSQPITQLTGVFALLVALQKAGIDIGGTIKWIFSRKDKENEADLRNLIQPLYTKMDILSQHFNHETTSELAGIKDAVEKMHEKQDEGNEILRAIDKYGIKCRKE